MIILYSKKFKKVLGKLPKKLERILKEKVKIFIGDPHNPILNNHALKGSMRNYRSINITGDFRIIFEEKEENVVRFMDLDNHNNLYGR